MTTYGQPPSGPGTPPPMPYAPPAQYGNYPLGPEPPKSSAWKYVLIGCAVLVFVVILAGFGTCYYVGKNAHAIATSGLKMIKPGYMNMLTPEHSAEERENFSRHMDLLADALGKEGFEKFWQKYGTNFQELNNIVQDQSITVEESQTWCENLDYALEGRTPPEKGEEESDEF